MVEMESDVGRKRNANVPAAEFCEAIYDAAKIITSKKSHRDPAADGEPRAPCAEYRLCFDQKCRRFVSKHMWR